MMHKFFEGPIAISFPGLDVVVQIYPLTDPVTALVFGFGAATVLGLLLTAPALNGSRQKHDSERGGGFSRARAALGLALRESLRYRGIAWSSAEAAGSRP